MENGHQILVGHSVREPYAFHACDAGTNVASPSWSILGLCFHVGMKDEHIRLDVSSGCQTIRFSESALFAALLRLARKRMDDEKAGILPPSEQGWLYTADFIEKLHLDEELLNVTVFRLRKLFQRRGIENAVNIVERRRKQLRIGTRRLTVIENSSRAQ